MNLLRQISTEQLGVVFGMAALLMAILGVASARQSEPAVSKLTVSDLKRQIPSASQVEVDLTPLSAWGLKTGSAPVDQNTGNPSNAQDLADLFSGPPPIFAVVKTGSVLSVYVQAEDGTKTLNLDDEFEGLVLKEIAMSFITFETEEGEFVTVSFFDYDGTKKQVSNL